VSKENVRLRGSAIHVMPITRSRKCQMGVKAERSNEWAKAAVKSAFA